MMYDQPWEVLALSDNDSPEAPQKHPANPVQPRKKRAAFRTSIIYFNALLSLRLSFIFCSKIISNIYVLLLIRLEGASYGDIFECAITFDGFDWAS